MAKKINQETFDDVVKENVQDFEMSVADAIKDAIDQFKAQGVDLSSIIKEESSYLPDGTKNLSNSLASKVTEKVQAINDFVASLSPSDVSIVETQIETLGEHCRFIIETCKTGLPERIVVGEAKTFDALMNGISMMKKLNWKIIESDIKLVGSDEKATNIKNHLRVFQKLLQTLVAVSFQQPDLLTSHHFDTLKHFTGLFLEIIQNNFKKLEENSKNKDLEKKETTNIVSKNMASLTINTSTTSILSIHLNHLKLLVDLFKNCMFMHEGNKHIINNSGLTKSFVHLLRDGVRVIEDNQLEDSSAEQSFKVLTHKICLLLRALVTDDDIRVTFGKSHDRSVYLVNECQAVSVLLHVFKVYHESKEQEKEQDKIDAHETSEIKEANGNLLKQKVQAELLSTIGSLSVREDVCVHICEEGGVKSVMELLDQLVGSNEVLDETGKKVKSALIKSSLQFIKALSGSDKVKQAVVEKQEASRIVPSIISAYLHDSGICQAAALCIASVCLRHGDYGAKFVQEGQIHLLCSKVMEKHHNTPAVLRACSIMIRNIVSRNQDSINLFIDEGVEKLLNKAIKDHEKVCGDEARYALRDLKCEVMLRTLWMGQGKQLQR